jgi:hypothetical protein
MVDDETYRANGVTTAILMDAGIALMRQNIRRRHPEQTEVEIDARLSEWLCRTAEPIPGDIAGPVRVREQAP